MDVRLAITLIIVAPGLLAACGDGGREAGLTQVQPSLVCARVDIPGDVPEDYASLYATLCERIGSFSRRIAEGEDTEHSQPDFGAHLLVADSDRGSLLLAPDALPEVEITLDRFRELGIVGVTLAIGYPMLTPDFPESARYLEFYRSVAEAVRRRGMQLAVEQIVVFANSEFSLVAADFSTLTFDRFVEEQQAMAQTIIDDLSPDYLTILHEPDTYAVLSSLKEFHDPGLAREYVERVSGGLLRGHTLIGAGAVNYNDTEFFRQFAETAVDYLDLHLYALTPGAIENAFEVGRIARDHGKRLLLSEAWLYKTDGTDAASQVSLAGWAEGFRLDVFSFWQPLDIAFHDAMVAFARSSGALYVSPFWSNYYFAYLEYGPATRDRSYHDLVFKLAPARVAEAITAGAFTETGERYRETIRAP